MTRAKMFAVETAENPAEAASDLVVSTLAREFEVLSPAHTSPSIPEPR